MPEHDSAYRLLFSHPEMVADLLQGFVKEPWVQELDFSTLELVSGSFVTEDLRNREDDIIWRVQWKGRQWLYVYVLMEFQSTVDPFMALRMMVYVGLLYQSLVRSKQLTEEGTLPPVLPLVLYNGARPWTAAQRVQDLIEQAPAGLDRYQPRLRYLLLEENRYTEEALSPLKNVAAAVFRLEQSHRPEDIERVVMALVQWLQSPEQSGLRRAFAQWIQRSLLPARLPGTAIPELQDLSRSSWGKRADFRG